METNKIERTLLDKELKNISEQLGKIGVQIQKVFEKYGTMKGEHAEELHKYIVENVLRAGTNYFAGYTTTPKHNTHPDHIPECIKELVLRYAVDEFFGKIDDIQSIVENMD
jgi:glycogen synthase